MSKPGSEEILTKREKQLIQTITTVYQQQKFMYDIKTKRCPDGIVNILQD